MLAFIGQYWLNFLLGLVATGAVAMAKRFKTLYQKEKEHEKEVEQEAFRSHIKEELLDVIKQNREESVNDDQEIREEIVNIQKELDILKNGILAIHGHSFKNNCKLLLEKDKITLEEWDALSGDHEVYNLLGGNHDGDRLYKDVEIKYRNQLD